jgi:hypothetical protein
MAAMAATTGTKRNQLSTGHQHILVLFQLVLHQVLLFQLLPGTSGLETPSVHVETS